MTAFLVHGRAARGVTRPAGSVYRNASSPQAHRLTLWYPLLDAASALVDYAGGNKQLAVLTSGATTGIGGNQADALTDGLSAVIGPGLPIRTSVQSNGSCQFRKTGLSGIGSTSDPFTMSVWVFSVPYPDGFHFVVGTGSAGVIVRGGNPYYIQNADAGGSVVSSGLTFANDLWRLVTYTWDGTTSRIYHNGQQTNTSATSPNGGAVTVAGVWTNPHDGFASQGTAPTGTRVADARFYARCLTATEVWQLYDPVTRWDLYWVPGRRVFFDVGASGVSLSPGVYAAVLTGQGVHLGFTINMPDEL